MSAEVQDKPAAELAGTQLITLDPRAYVAAVYAPFRERLDAAKAAVATITTVDVTTKDAMAVAIKHRATFRGIRVEAEKARAARKAPVLEIGRLLDGRYREIESEILADESRFDEAIKAEETRKERERQERERAEQERVAKIQDNLARLSNAAGAYAGKRSTEIAEGLERIRTHDVSTWAQEYLPIAQEAHAKAVAALEQLHAGAVAQEQAAAAEAKRIADEREELARLRAEAETRAKEEQARAAAIARQQAEEAAAARAKIEAEERASRERIEVAERLARQQREAAEAEAQKIADEFRKARDAEEAKAKAVRDAEEARQAAERKRLDDEARALAERERQTKEREAEVRREIERQQTELLDGNALLAKFVERFGKRREFAAVVKAINAHLGAGKKAAA